MKSIIELIKKVLGTGEIITIIYNGGSRPGQAREIVPLSLSDDKLLVAIEPGSQTQKHYKIERIATIRLSSGQCLHNLQASRPVIAHTGDPDDLRDFINRYSAEFKVAGWHMRQRKNSFELAGFFKNGKPRKTPSVSISYVDRSNVIELELYSDELVERKKELTGRERPWQVDSPRFKESRTYGDCNRAFETFLEESRASDPWDK